MTGEEAEQFVREATDNYNQAQKELYQGRARGKGQGELPTAQQIVQAEKEGAAKVKFIEELNAKRGNIESTISNYQLARMRWAKVLRQVALLVCCLISQATAQMIETARQRLGLDVIGSITFGALSEGELKLALDTGLPSANLSNEELTKCGHRPYGGAAESIAGS